jgi:hypothetical protein
MSKTVTCGAFWTFGFLGGLGAIGSWPSPAREGLAAEAPEGLCITLCNHCS